MKRSSKLLVAVLATSAVTAFSQVAAAGVATPAQAARNITFIGSPGVNAPPSTLGPYTMKGFGKDAQPTQNVTGAIGPTGKVGFSPALIHKTVGSGWSTWSNGYKGDVYVTLTGTKSEKLTLPAGTLAFYFYAEPDQLAINTVTATAQDGTSSGPIDVDGRGGAHYFGFYSAGSTQLSIINVTSSDADFAVGEFGISG